MGARIEIRPLTLAIGAEVGAASTCASRSTDDEVAALRQALLDHLVLFFRDQHIDDDAAARVRAALRPDARLAARRPSTRTRPRSSCSNQVHPVGEGADEWHSDNTFLADPPMGSILRAVQLPELGGDTCFASMYAAYDGALTRDARVGRRSARGARHHPSAAEGDPRRSLVARPRRDAAEVPAGGAQRRRHASRDRAQGAVRQPQLHHAPRGSEPIARTTSCCRSCSTTSARPSTSAGSTGSRDRSRSGTTARCSTTRSPTTASGASCTARRSPGRWRGERRTTRRGTCRSRARSASSRGSTRVGLLVDAFQHRCLDQFGLRFIDYSVLRVLELVGEPHRMSPTELSEIVVRSSGGMTQILDRLERAGLVARTPDPADRRKVLVALTAGGPAHRRRRQRALRGRARAAAHRSVTRRGATPRRRHPPSPRSDDRRLPRRPARRARLTQPSLVRRGWCSPDRRGWSRTPCRGRPR